MKVDENLVQVTVGVVMENLTCVICVIMINCTLVPLHAIEAWLTNSNVFSQITIDSGLEHCASTTFDTFRLYGQA
jgi:hypothetical protein